MVTGTRILSGIYEQLLLKRASDQKQMLPGWRQTG